MWNGVSTFFSAWRNASSSAAQELSGHPAGGTLEQTCSTQHNSDAPQPLPAFERCSEAPPSSGDLQELSAHSVGDTSCAQSCPDPHSLDAAGGTSEQTCSTQHNSDAPQPLPAFERCSEAPPSSGDLQQLSAHSAAGTSCAQSVPDPHSLDASPPTAPQCSSEALPPPSKRWNPSRTGSGRMSTGTPILGDKKLSHVQVDNGTAEAASQDAGITTNTF